MESTISSGVVTCQLASVILLLAPTVVANTASGSIFDVFETRGCADSAENSLKALNISSSVCVELGLKVIQWDRDYLVVPSTKYEPSVRILIHDLFDNLTLETC